MMFQRKTRAMVHAGRMSLGMGGVGGEVLLRQSKKNPDFTKKERKKNFGEDSRSARACVRKAHKGVFFEKCGKKRVQGPASKGLHAQKEAGRNLKESLDYSRGSEYGPVTSPKKNSSSTLEEHY